MRTEEFSQYVPGLPDFGIGLAKVLIFGVFLAFAWIAFNWLTKTIKDEQEMFEGGNTPFTIIRGSVLVAQALAMSPLMGTTTANQSSQDLIWLAIGGVWVILVFAGARLFIERLVGGNTRADINNLHNLGLAPAVAQSGFYVAVGLIIGSTFVGSAPTVWIAAGSIALFGFLGLLALGTLYVIFAKRADLHVQINSKNNVAAAIAAAALLVTFALAIAGGIEGDWNGLAPGLVGFAVALLFAVITLLALYYGINKWLVGSSISTGVQAYLNSRNDLKGSRSRGAITNQLATPETDAAITTKLKVCCELNKMLIRGAMLLAAAIGIGSIIL